jgi:hypothetical protein
MNAEERLARLRELLVAEISSLRELLVAEMASDDMSLLYVNDLFESIRALDCSTDRLALLEGRSRAANNELLPRGAAGTTIVNDGRPT